MSEFYLDHSSQSATSLPSLKASEREELRREYIELCTANRVDPRPEYLDFSADELRQKSRLLRTYLGNQYQGATPPPEKTRPQPGHAGPSTPADGFDTPMEPDYFVMCPRGILTNPDLSDLSLRVYMVLLDYARGKGECWPKVETIAKAIGRKSLSDVRDAFRDLEKLDLIRREIRKPAPTRYKLRKTPAIKSNRQANRRNNGG